MRTKSGLHIFMFLGVATLAACGSNTQPAESVEQVTAAIEMANGGLTTDEEMPQFGEDEAFNELEMHPPMQPEGPSMMQAPMAGDICDRALMVGRWKWLRPDAVGVYRGLVLGPHLGVRGHVRGLFGIRRNGEHVFFGKIINRRGRFVGLMGGTWGDGKFHARWIIRSGDHGVGHGLYFDDRPLADGKGVFVGVLEERSCTDPMMDGHLDSEPASTPPMQ